jgi:hypothetical protein
LIAPSGFSEADIRAKVIAGRGDGTWNGTAGITSTSAGGDRAIGYRVVNGSMEVAYAAPGDSNLDGVVDILDLSEILGGGKFDTWGAANWQQGDTNYDGVFDILDLSDILGTGRFDQGSYLPQGSVSSATATVTATAPLDPAIVFAAYGMELSTPITAKRRLLQ